MAVRSAPLRPFGLAAGDLDIDFASPDRPALVTALLDSCATSADPGPWREQPVGARHRAMLALLQVSEAIDAVACTTCCPACGERAELALPLGDLQALPSGGAAVEVVIGGRRLCLRRPTGDDLRAWREAPPHNRGEVLQSLLQDGELQPGDEETVARALADADPLVAFSVQCACPACGEMADHEVDLEALVLQRLAQRQHAVLREVHRLASHYGWTEAQVFAVAPSRRARYLALIADMAAMSAPDRSPALVPERAARRALL